MAAAPRGGGELTVAGLATDGEGTGAGEGAAEGAVSGSDTDAVGATGVGVVGAAVTTGAAEGASSDDCAVSSMESDPCAARRGPKNASPSATITATEIADAPTIMIAFVGGGERSPETGLESAALVWAARAPARSTGRAESGEP